MFGPPALVLLAAAYGMGRARLWGWWLALLSDMGLIAVCAYSLVDDGWGEIDWELVLFAVIPMLGAILLLTPVVRSSYWRRQEDALPKTAG
jgi:hypothetical protein